MKVTDGSTNITERENVINAYRFILGREPENEEAITSHLANSKTIEELRNVFLSSVEFQSTVGGQSKFDFFSLPLQIETALTPEAQEQVFRATAKVWNEYGQTEPYWSVLTSDKFLSKNIDDNIDEFYQTGKESCSMLLATLRRHGLTTTQTKSISEIGCGTGRVTYWLAQNFTKVFAYDISQGNLALAKQKCTNANNVDFVKINSIVDYNTMPKTDVFFSIIVLQHNPPPVIAYCIRCMLNSLNADGIAFFQVPTYKTGYFFSATKYQEEAGKTMEMHCLPQHQIFSIAKECDCIPLEVYEDCHTGNADISNIFVFKKLAISRSK